MNKLNGMLLAAMLVSGCTGGEMELKPVADLDAAKALWVGAGVDKYEMTIEQRCYCPLELVQPIRISVKGDEIVAVKGLEMAIEKEDLAKSELKTVTKLFEFLEQAKAGQPQKLIERYNPQYGYPERIEYDGHARVADDEYVFLIRDFSPQI